MENEKLEPQDVLSEIRSIKPESFEYFISDLWEYIGYNTNVTKHSSDKGIDIVASREFPYNERILIQAKRYGSESTISGPEMQKYGRLSGKEDIDTVLIISTGGFTKQAEEIADEDNLKCIGGKSLSNLVIRENIYNLVKSYTNEGGEVSLEQKRSPQNPEQSYSEQNLFTGEGDCLEIEVVGFDNVNIQYEDRDKDLLQKKKYTVICMHVRNKTEYEWDFFGRNDLAVTSSDGFSYNNHQNNSWSNRTGQLTPWNNGKIHDIKPNSKSRVVAIYKSWFDPAKVEYTTKILHSHGDDDLSDGKERITVHIDESTREELQALPDSFPTNQIVLN